MSQRRPMTGVSGRVPRVSGSLEARMNGECYLGIGRSAINEHLHLNGGNGLSFPLVPTQAMFQCIVTLMRFNTLS